MRLWRGDTSPLVAASVGDISKPADLDGLFADVENQQGGLDGLVNNAGSAGATTPVADYPIDTWNAVVGINLTGTFMVTQRAIPLLKKSSAASIIVMSSLAGRFGYPNRVAYSTTKWGLVGVANTLSMELGPLGVTTNTIHPGAVDGPRIHQVVEGRAKASGRTGDEETLSALSNQSVKKFVDPTTSLSWRSFWPARTRGRFPDRCFPSTATQSPRCDHGHQPIQRPLIEAT